MDKEFVLKSARQLNIVSEAAAAEYNKKADYLILRINTLMLERPDIESLVGKNNLEMMKDNHSNHVRFIASILKNYNAEVLVETILWGFRAYRSHGFNSNYWDAQLKTWIIILKEIMTPESYNEIYRIYEWMQINIPLFVTLSDEKLEISDSLN